MATRVTAWQWTPVVCQGSAKHVPILCWYELNNSCSLNRIVLKAPLATSDCTTSTGFGVKSADQWCWLQPKRTSCGVNDLLAVWASWVNTTDKHSLAKRWKLLLEGLPTQNTAAFLPQRCVESISCGAQPGVDKTGWIWKEEFNLQSVHLPLCDVCGKLFCDVSCPLPFSPTAASDRHGLVPLSCRFTRLEWGESDNQQCS